MNETYRCPKCGQPVPPDAPEGLCPRCLGALNLDSETGLSGSGAGAAPPPPSAPELSPHFPQLEILEVIGQGGMGVVYKVRQKELDRIAALKVLPPGIGGDPAFAERFAREAKALARLNHPGIVTIYDFGRADGLFYFLMEFVDGVSLRRLMHAGRVSPREALAIVPQLCDALQYAHDQGIVHRDIKPENILLDRQGRVKVADFGLAKLLGTGKECAASGGVGPAPSPGLTGAGKVVGTPRYMAPEQAEHPGEVDHRADIYALGVVFYQMLTGELPGQRLEPPSKKVQIDVRLDEVVLRALEKEPERRYQQVSQVKTAVETIVQTAAPDALKGEAGRERRATRPNGRSASSADADEIEAFLHRIATRPNGRAGSRAGGWPKYAYVGVAAGIAAVLAIWFCLHLWLRSPGPLGGSRNRGPVKQLSATTVRKGDIGVHLDSLGTVESSNSVTFTIPEDQCQEVIRQFDAHQALTVEAYNRQGERFGHGFLAGVDNRMDTSTGTLKCRASLMPEGENLMVPGRFLNLRMLLEVKHGVTLVPADAILRDPQSAFAWVIQSDATVSRRPVRVGVVDGKWAEIQSGLSPGEVVLSGGSEDLRQGQQVRYDLAPEAEPAPASSQPGEQPAGQNAIKNLAPGVNTPTNQPPASPPTVDQVLARYTQARGGLAAAQGTTSLMLEGTFESRDGLGTLEVEALVKSPDKWLLVLKDEQGPVFRRAFDGAAGWEVSKWGGAGGVDAGALLASRTLIGLYRGEQLATLLPNLSLKGKETIGNREVCVLEVALPQGPPPRLWFETQTGLLVRIEYAIGNSQLQLDVDDYRDIGGLMVPFKLRQTGAENWIVRCSAVKRNEPLEDGRFQRPASQ